MYMEVQVPWEAGSRERPGAIHYLKFIAPVRRSYTSAVSTLDEK